MNFLRLILSLGLYNLALPAALFLLLPDAIIKLRKRGGKPKDLLQKAGRYPARIVRKISQMERPIWIHAVSVGETQVALKLIREIRSQAPDIQIVLSTTTTTAQQLAHDNLPDDDDFAIIYNPVDFPPTVERTLHLIRPSLIVLVEAEVWPNLCALARRRHIPLTLVNARMSHRSERRLRRMRFFVAPIFSLLDRVCIQEPRDLEQFAGVGMRREAIRHTGSIKFDPPPPPNEASIAAFRDLLRPLLLITGADTQVLLAASTFPGEEKLIGESFKVLRHQFPGLFLITAPRHAERAEEAVADLREIGLRPTLRSQLPLSSGEGDNKTAPRDCLVIDTTGELPRWQALATVVVIGKSFLAQGGQNPAEAAALGIPTVLGPHMQNFKALVNHMLAAGGTVQMNPGTELTPQLSHLLGDDKERERIGDAAKLALESHRGATTRAVALLLQEIPSHRLPEKQKARAVADS